MTARFRCSDPLAGDLAFPDVESLLDALEAALVAPDTPMLDAVRQSWQPVAAHPEVRAAWVERARFQPPGGTALRLPPLPEIGAVAAVADDEAVRRRQAYARLRERPLREPPAAELPSPGSPSAAILAVLGVVLLLALLGWGMVALAVKLSAFAARAAGVGGH